MADKIAIKQLQGLEQISPFVTLFELEYDDAGTKKYFVRGGEEDLSTVQFRDYDSPGTVRTYEILPITIEGLEHSSTGPSARPVLRVANVLNTFETAVGINLDNLIGKKLIRRRTLKKYLYGEAGDANPPIEFPRQVYIIDRIETRNAMEVAFELTTPFEVEGLNLPYRVVGHNACSWIYQGSSPTKSVANQVGGCTWHAKGKYNLKGVTFTVHVNYDDEYVIPSSTSFTSYSSGTVNADLYRSTTVTYSNGSAGGVYRLKADGSLDTSTSGNLTNYWQAVRTTTNTPSDSNTDWSRVRIYQTYSNSTTWYAYNDDRYSDYVIHNDLIWKAKRTQASGGSQIAPSATATDYSERGDVCGKRLNSCKCRFGFNPITATSASSTGKGTKDTELSLPFGGFPGARKFK